MSVCTLRSFPPLHHDGLDPGLVGSQLSPRTTRPIVSTMGTMPAVRPFEFCSVDKLSLRGGGGLGEEGDQPTERSETTRRPELVSAPPVSLISVSLALSSSLFPDVSLIEGEGFFFFFVACVFGSVFLHLCSQLLLV